MRMKKLLKGIFLFAIMGLVIFLMFILLLAEAMEISGKSANELIGEIYEKMEW